MDFAPSQEQVAVFDLAKSFGTSRIAPFARQWESEGTIPRNLWNEAAKLGLCGLYVSEEFGGANLSRLEGTFIFEALSHACPSVSALLSIHNMCGGMLNSFGSDELKSRYLPKMTAADLFFSYCLTEPSSGSDAAALKTKATKIDQSWRLSGTKSFISGAGYSDAYIVMARSGGDGSNGISAFVVEDGISGLTFGAVEQKMGWKSQPTRQVYLDQCSIPVANLLGKEGSGFKYAMAALDGGRLNIAACSLGAAQSALEKAVAYAAERQAFGKSLDQFQALQFKLADCEIELQAARILLRQAAWALDNGLPDASKQCAAAKAFVTEAGSRVADRCLQMHGGYGYLADYGIEKIVRDLRVHTILEGTNEIMRLIVARDLISNR